MSSDLFNLVGHADGSVNTDCKKLLMLCIEIIGAFVYGTRPGAQQIEATIQSLLKSRSW